MIRVRVGEKISTSVQGEAGDSLAKLRSFFDSLEDSRQVCLCLNQGLPRPQRKMLPFLSLNVGFGDPNVYPKSSWYLTLIRNQGFPGIP